MCTISQFSSWNSFSHAEIEPSSVELQGIPKMLDFYVIHTLKKEVKQHNDSSGLRLQIQ